MLKSIFPNFLLFICSFFSASISTGLQAFLFTKSVSKASQKCAKDCWYQSQRTIKSTIGITKEMREGAAFLITYIPNNDLEMIKSDILIQNIKKAYQARSTFS